MCIIKFLIDCNFSVCIVDMYIDVLRFRIWVWKEHVFQSIM